jgi:hypothetical protein
LVKNKQRTQLVEAQKFKVKKGGLKERQKKGKGWRNGIPLESVMQSAGPY